MNSVRKHRSLGAALMMAAIVSLGIPAQASPEFETFIVYYEGCPWNMVGWYDVACGTGGPTSWGQQSGTGMTITYTSCTSFDAFVEYYLWETDHWVQVSEEDFANAC